MVGLAILAFNFCVDRRTGPFWRSFRKCGTQFGPLRVLSRVDSGVPFQCSGIRTVTESAQAHSSRRVHSPYSIGTGMQMLDMSHLHFRRDVLALNLPPPRTGPGLPREVPGGRADLRESEAVPGSAACTRTWRARGSRGSFTFFSPLVRSSTCSSERFTVIMQF